MWLMPCTHAWAPQTTWQWAAPPSWRCASPPLPPAILPPTPLTCLRPILPCLNMLHATDCAKLKASGLRHSLANAEGSALRPMHTKQPSIAGCAWWETWAALLLCQLQLHGCMWEGLQVPCQHALLPRKCLTWNQLNTNYTSASSALKDTEGTAKALRHVHLLHTHPFSRA